MHTEPGMNETPTSQAQEGWIALAPIHLFPWIILGAGFLQDLVYALLPRFGGPVVALGWVFTLVIWGLGGFALAVALREEASLPERRWAFGLAAGALGLQVAQALAWRILPDGFIPTMTLYWGFFFVRTFLCGGALVGLLRIRDGASGGPFDAAVAALAIAAGLDWLALPFLAFGVLAGHPLLVALLQALRQPSEALRSGWLDALDPELRFSRLGLGALVSALALMALIARLSLRLTTGYHSFQGPYAWWAGAELLAATLAALVLAFHVLRQARRSGVKRGRGLAIVALVITGLPLLLILAAAIILVLILTDVIPFRLF